MRRASFVSFFLSSLVISEGGENTGSLKNSEQYIRGGRSPSFVEEPTNGASRVESKPAAPSVEPSTPRSRRVSEPPKSFSNLALLAELRTLVREALESDTWRETQRQTRCSTAELADLMAKAVLETHRSSRSNSHGGLKPAECMDLARLRVVLTDFILGELELEELWHQRY